jgi:uncharacterized membrane protein YjgN (DUF898 family)
VNQMGSVPQHPPPLPPLPPAPVSFCGDRGVFRRLVTRGAGLELVTVGFYRFWLATDIRRHLWSNTDIGDNAAEYTGRGKELLLGFLFALAILVPIYLAYFLIGLEAERNRQLSSSPLLVLLYAFGQFAIYRARRYRLTRTVWRGVRFWMDGSAVAYAGLAAFWSLLTVLTLGLALPWREAALERYKMGHSHYGDLEGRFEGQGWEFFKRGWWLWLAAVMPFVLLLTVAGTVSPAARMKIPLFIGIPMLLLAPILYGVFKAVQWDWWLSGIRFGDVRIESALRRGALIGLYWKVIGWTLPLLTLLTAYIYLCGQLLARLGLAPFAIFGTNGRFQGSAAMLVLGGGGYLVFLLAMNVVLRVYLLRDVWARVVSSTTVHNIEAAANVAAEGELANALGEGFADGLDVAGF